MEEIKTACCECETVINTEAIDAIIEPKSPIKVKRRVNKKKSATLQQMMVESVSAFEYTEFNKDKISDSLEKEAGLNNKDAKEIANIVEKKLIDSKMQSPTTGLIREIINATLLEKGHMKELDSYSNISMSLSTIDGLIKHHNFENSNTGFSPESINLMIAGQSLKQYALKAIMPKDVAEAHLKGDIHFHDLDFINRPYCSGNSIEYIKKYGLNLPGVLAVSSPAKHALTLVNHVSCFAQYLQGLMSGAIGFSNLNMFFAPLLEGMTCDQIKQCAQHLIYSFAQLSGNRGGQTVFSDLNVDLIIPSYFENTPAIGKGGEYTGRTYAAYGKEARLFLEAILDVLSEGDANGANFAFPKILLHVDENTDFNNDKLFIKSCEVNSKRGSVYILFDRGKSVKVSQCCRLSLTLSQDELDRMIKHPDQMRFSAINNITINLPRIGYKFNKEEDIFSEIDRLIDLSGRGHLSKKKLINDLLDLGEKGPLSFLAYSPMSKDAYLRKDEMKFLVGMVGLNELVLKHTGKEMHEDEEAYKFGLKVIAHMKNSLDRMATKNDMTCLLEETPAEGCSQRLALLDLKYFPTIAHNFVKGITGESDYKYYTNSVHLSYSSNMDILSRITKQAKFCPMIQAGSMIHVWLGESCPDPKSIAKLIEIIMKETNATQISFSPDFTSCQDCHKTDKGLFIKCKQCGSDNVYSMTRITGYFSKISGWTKGKLAELANRTRHTITTEVIKSKDEAEEIVFFSKPNCQKCDVAKDRLKQSNHSIKIYDTSTDEGLAMACYYNVDGLPAMMKVKGDQIISSWSHDTSMIKWLKMEA